MTGTHALDPAIPPVYLVLALAALVALAWRSGRARYALLRTAPLALIGLVLLGPVTIRELPDERRPPALVLLIDRSRSMATPDARPGATPVPRLRAVEGAYLEPNTLRRFGELADVRPVAFASDARAISGWADRAIELRPTGAATDLHGALARTLADLPEGSTVVVLSDGRSTSPRRDIGELVGLARASSVRVHAVPVGEPSSATDVRLRAAPARDLVFESMPVDIDVSLDQAGYDGRRATVRVLDETGERTLASRTVTLDARTDLTISVPGIDLPPGSGTSGVRELRVRVDALTGEADDANNERRVFVRVTGERIRVALLEGAPSWESRFLARTLAKDPQVELTTVTGVGTSETRRDGQRVVTPRRIVRLPGASGEVTAAGGVASDRMIERAIAESDIVVLGTRIDAVLTPGLAERLATRTSDDGGAVIFLSAPPAPLGSPVASALDPIAPINWTDAVLPGGALTPSPGADAYPPVGTLAGEGGAVLTDLPGMRAVTRTDGARSVTTLWLTDTSDEGESRAALAHARVGRGQSLALLSEGLWRWALTPGSLDAHDAVYREFWARTVRWLALGGDFLPGQGVSFRADRTLVSPGERVSVTVRARTRDDLLAVERLEHVTPDGTITNVRLREDASDTNALRASVSPLAEGVHELRLHESTGGVRTIRFAAHDDSDELRDVSPDTALLRAIAEGTGGELLPLDGRDRLLELLEQDRAARATEVRTARTIAWDSPWLFAAIVGLLLIEWLWRRADS